MKALNHMSFEYLSHCINFFRPLLVGSSAMKFLSLYFRRNWIIRETDLWHLWRDKGGLLEIMDWTVGVCRLVNSHLLLLPPPTNEKLRVFGSVLNFPIPTLCASVSSHELPRPVIGCSESKKLEWYHSIESKRSSSSILGPLPSRLGFPSLTITRPKQDHRTWPLIRYVHLQRFTVLWPTTPDWQVL